MTAAETKALEAELRSVDFARGMAESGEQGRHKWPSVALAGSPLA